MKGAYNLFFHYLPFCSMYVWLQCQLGKCLNPPILFSPKDPFLSTSFTMMQTNSPVIIITILKLMEMRSCFPMAWLGWLILIRLSSHEMRRSFYTEEMLMLTKRIVKVYYRPKIIELDALNIAIMFLEHVIFIANSRDNKRMITWQVIFRARGNYRCWLL